MIPRHTGDVGFAELDCPLTEDDLRRFFIGRCVYTRSRFCAITDGREWSVIELEKRRSKKLFQTVTGLTMLSPPERTRYVEEPELDVMNLGDMVRVQGEYPGDMVIVKGKFEHLSFIDLRLPARIRLVDLVPPRPSRMESLLRDILGSSWSLLDIEVALIDLSELVGLSSFERILLPCRATYDGLPAQQGREILFLDSAPDIHEDEGVQGTLLIGCTLSARIFSELYGDSPNHLNVCPRESELMRTSDRPVLTRCCKVKEGVELNGGAVTVPWGANISEVSEALRIALCLADQTSISESNLRTGQGPRHSLQ